MITPMRMLPIKKPAENLAAIFFSMKGAGIFSCCVSNFITIHIAARAAIMPSDPYTSVKYCPPINADKKGFTVELSKMSNPMKNTQQELARKTDLAEFGGRGSIPEYIAVV